MGIYDRDYGRPQQQQYYAMGSGVRGIPPVVKWLLIINFAIYIFVKLVPAIGQHIYELGVVFPHSLKNTIQLWRLVSYQFLHDPEHIWHLIFNMIVLYFMGPFIERSFGSRAFLKFYLICGAAGGGCLYTLGAFWCAWNRADGGGIRGYLWCYGGGCHYVSSDEGSALGHYSNDDVLVGDISYHYEFFEYCSRRKCRRRGGASFGIGDGFFVYEI